MRLIPKRLWARLALGVLLGGLVAYACFIHGFLAETRPVSGRVLIVESWFYDRPGLAEAVPWYGKGSYEFVLCVGASVPGSSKAAFPSYADLAAQRLIALGLDRKLVHVVRVTEAGEGRTFGSALAVRDWLKRERPDVRSADVFTIGVHARKSHLLFSKALGPGFTVGIIAATESAYPPGRWWASPAGWRIVLRNTVGYGQALLQSPEPER